jgi:hypothetical protein
MTTINYYSSDATRIVRTRTYRTVSLAMRAVARAAKRGTPTAKANEQKAEGRCIDCDSPSHKTGSAMCPDRRWEKE